VSRVSPAFAVEPQLRKIVSQIRPDRQGTPIESGLYSLSYHSSLTHNSDHCYTLFILSVDVVRNVAERDRGVGE